MSMFDMMGAMGKVKEMKQKMEEVQTELAGLDFVASHADLSIYVKVSGKKEIKEIVVTPETWIQHNPDHVVAGILATTNAALANADMGAKLLIAERTEGILPKIPGFDMASLFNK